jgi:hypothetical protein
MPDEGRPDTTNRYAPISVPTSWPKPTRLGYERQATDILSSVNDDLVMGLLTNPPPTPKLLQMLSGPLMESQHGVVTSHLAILPLPPRLLPP